jgi:hypothetical protein
MTRVAFAAIDERNWKSEVRSGGALLDVGRREPDEEQDGVFIGLRVPDPDQQLLDEILGFAIEGKEPQLALTAVARPLEECDLGERSQHKGCRARHGGQGSAVGWGAT